MYLIAIFLLLCTAVFLELCHQALRRKDPDAPTGRTHAGRTEPDPARLGPRIASLAARARPDEDSLRRPPAR